MTPKQLHTQLSALWPKASDNGFEMYWRGLLYVAAMFGLYDKFASVVLQPAGRGGLYIASKFPKGLDCKCYLCQVDKLLKAYARTLPVIVPNDGQMRLAI